MDRLRHYLRVVEALVLLVVARALRRWVPMRRWAGILGPAGPPTTVAAGDGSRRRERAVAGAVERAVARLPASCLEQAVAGSLMLRIRREPGVVVIGLDAADPSGAPHAWLVGRSGHVLLGNDPRGRYRAVSQFGSRPKP